jgi:hypothetical protein
MKNNISFQLYNEVGYCIINSNERENVRLRMSIDMNGDWHWSVVDEVSGNIYSGNTGRYSIDISWD